MDFKVGDIVSRNSHNNDIVFEIVEIKDDIAYLRGVNERLYADAHLKDLVISEVTEEFKPDIPDNISNRDDYFYLPGKILHIDGDINYLNKSLNYYKEAGVFAIGKNIKECDIGKNLRKLLIDTNPDILVITGHDALINRNNKVRYKNSKYFIDAVRIAREYEKSHEKLVIIAGACQSDYENLIKSVANFASSPKRINIHALDPAIIAVNISLTEKDKKINIKYLLSKTKYGKYGIGGLVGNGMMYVGYPR